uniref:Uncharacterized protein n=1 Tax=Strigops habroptila TaxID=2489341 RepID=A0A672TF09_STRHB
ITCVYCFLFLFPFYPFKKNPRVHSWAWWHVPVVLATWEAEPAGSLEPRSSGLQCAMPSRCPCYGWHQYSETGGAGACQVD